MNIGKIDVGGVIHSERYGYGMITRVGPALASSPSTTRKQGHNIERRTAKMP